MKAEGCRKMRVRFGKYGLVGLRCWSRTCCGVTMGRMEVDECCDPLLPEVVGDVPVVLRHDGLRMESVERCKVVFGE